MSENNIKSKRSRDDEDPDGNSEKFFDVSSLDAMPQSELESYYSRENIYNDISELIRSGSESSDIELLQQLEQSPTYKLAFVLYARELLPEDNWYYVHLSQKSEFPIDIVLRMFIKFLTKLKDIKVDDGKEHIYHTYVKKHIEDTISKAVKLQGKVQEGESRDKLKDLCAILAGESANKLYTVSIIKYNRDVVHGNIDTNTELSIRTSYLGHIMRIGEFKHDFYTRLGKQMYEILSRLFGTVIYEKYLAATTQSGNQPTEYNKDMEELFLTPLSEIDLARYLVGFISPLCVKEIDKKLHIIKSSDVYSFAAPSSLPTYLLNKTNVVCSDSGAQVPLILQNVAINDILTSNNAPFTKFDAGPQPTLSNMFAVNEDIQSQIPVKIPGTINIFDFTRKKVMISIIPVVRENSILYSIVDNTNLCGLRDSSLITSIAIKDVSIQNVFDVFCFFTIQIIIELRDRLGIQLPEILHSETLHSENIPSRSYSTEEDMKIIFNFLTYLNDELQKVKGGEGTILGTDLLHDIIYFLYTIFFLKALGDLLAYYISLVFRLESSVHSPFSETGILSSGDYSLMQISGIDVKFCKHNNERLVLDSDIARTDQYNNFSIISTVHLPNQNDVVFPITEKQIIIFKLTYMLHSQIPFNIFGVTNENLKKIVTYYSEYLDIELLNHKMNKNFTTVLSIINSIPSNRTYQITKFIPQFGQGEIVLEGSVIDGMKSNLLDKLFYDEHKIPVLFEANLLNDVMIERSITSTNTLITNLTNTITFINKEYPEFIGKYFPELLLFCNKLVNDLNIVYKFLENIKNIFQGITDNIRENDEFQNFKNSVLTQEIEDSYKIDESTFLFAKTITHFMYGEHDYHDSELLLFIEDSTTSSTHDFTEGGKKYYKSIKISEQEKTHKNKKKITSKKYYKSIKKYKNPQKFFKNKTRKL
jgi:hypothetical protein